MDKALREEGIATYYDDSGSIEGATPGWTGRDAVVRYHRLRHPGEGDVTIRDRDTSEQLRMSADDVVPWIKEQLKRKLSC